MSHRREATLVVVAVHRTIETTAVAVEDHRNTIVVVGRQSLSSSRATIVD